MRPRVLDASVVAAAFFREEHADRASALLAGKGELLAPDLICVELANVIWKRCGRGEINREEAAQVLADMRRLPLRLIASAGLLDEALELALRTSRTVYDCLYLALAVRSGATMVSADRRLVNALADTPLAKHIVWLGDVR